MNGCKWHLNCLVTSRVSDRWHESINANRQRPFINHDQSWIDSAWCLLIVVWSVCDGSACLVWSPGGGQRSDRGDPVHHERSAGVSDLLAHLQHHGGQPVRWEVWALRQQNGLHLQRFRHQQQVWVSGDEQHTVLLDQSQSQLRQRGRRVPRAPASGELLQFNHYNTCWSWHF